MVGKRVSGRQKSKMLDWMKKKLNVGDGEHLVAIAIDRSWGWGESAPP